MTGLPLEDDEAAKKVEPVAGAGGTGTAGVRDEPCGWMISAGRRIGVGGASSKSISWTATDSDEDCLAEEGRPLPLTMAFLCFLGTGAGTSSSTSIPSCSTEEDTDLSRSGLRFVDSGGGRVLLLPLGTVASIIACGEGSSTSAAVGGVGFPVALDRLGATFLAEARGLTGLAV